MHVLRLVQEWRAAHRRWKATVAPLWRADLHRLLEVLASPRAAITTVREGSVTVDVKPWYSRKARKTAREIAKLTDHIVERDDLYNKAHMMAYAAMMHGQLLLHKHYTPSSKEEA